MAEWSSTRVTASCNQATLRMSLRHAGFDANNPMWLHAEVKQLELDRQLLGVLPEALQRNGKSTVRSE